MKGKQLPILDHGYLQFIESWGSDQQIVSSARMSTNKGFIGWGLRLCQECKGNGDIGNASEPCKACKGKGEVAGDEKLLAYLYKHQHTTPFEVCGMTVEVGCPVVVVWQWVRHRTLSYNILSGRYAEMPDDDYMPTLERCMVDGMANKQAGKADGAAVLTSEAAQAWLAMLTKTQAAVDECYQHGLAIGIPKELARLPLGFARYTRMRVSGNLLNWLKFLKLRMAGDAQSEIRQYANAVGDLIAERFPRTWELFKKE